MELRPRILAVIPILLLIGCASSPRYGAGGTSKKPATRDTARHPRVIEGVSSFYGPDFHGKLTANGEVYDMYGLTA
ncbi:MAG: septal ring lytic transglycosylase RlpA family lipoprotein, partial [Candidatus Neomarinimicrobiota bacterium]